MSNSIQFRILAWLSVVVLSGHLTGCDGDSYQSEEDFLAEVRSSRTGGDEGVGTMPSVDESFDKVARIRFETQEMDVGVIANDRLHHEKLKVYNDGMMPLKITNITTSCACTQGSVTPETAVIPPGGESWIDVVVDPYRIPGFESRKVLSITSTDPMRGIVEVGVSAKVAPEYEVEKDEIEVGDLMKGESVEKKIRFRQVQDKPVTIKSVEPVTFGPRNPKIPGVSGRFEAVPEDQWQEPGKPEYDIIITVGPELPAGPFERTVALATDIARFEKLGIRITGTVLAPYRVVPLYPEHATFGRGHDGNAIQAHVSVSADSPVSLSDFEVAHPNLSVIAEPGLNPNEAALEITLQGEPPRAPFDEIVRYRVNVDGRTFDEFSGVRFGVAPSEHDGHAGHAGHAGHNH